MCSTCQAGWSPTKVARMEGDTVAAQLPAEQQIDPDRPDPSRCAQTRMHALHEGLGFTAGE